MNEARTVHHLPPYYYYFCIEKFCVWAVAAATVYTSGQQQQHFWP